MTHNLPTDDLENINSTKKGRDLLLADKPRMVTWGTEGMLQRIQRDRRPTLHRSAHPQREQDQMEKSSYGLDWQHRGIWYGPAKLDNKPQKYKLSDEIIKPWKPGNWNWQQERKA